MPAEGVMTNRIRVRYRCPLLTAHIPTPYPTAAPDTHNKHQQLHSAPNMCPRKPGHPGSILGCPLHTPPRYGGRASLPAYTLACPLNQLNDGSLAQLTSYSSDRLPACLFTHAATHNTSHSHGCIRSCTAS